MTRSSQRPRGVRFGDYQLDLLTGELRRGGSRLRLQDKPFQILLALLERPGEVVTREDLRSRLWPGDTFVDFEHSLNNAVNRLRETLHDSAEKSRFVETLPKLGYRFIFPVEVDGHELHRPKLAEMWSASGCGDLEALRPRGPWLRVAAALAPVALVAVVVWLIMPSPALDAGLQIRVVSTAQVTRVGRVVGYVATDGKQVFMSVRTGGEIRLAMASVSGGEPLEIPTPFPNPIVYDISLDGSELLVGSHHGLRSHTPVWVVRIGSGVQRLGDIAAHDAAWSNDMRRIVYTAGSDLLLSDATGGGLRTLASTDGSPVRPAWSPDDRTIRFTLEDATTGAHSIWEIASDGTGLRQILPLRADPDARFADGASSGVWSPDGRFFFYRALRGTESQLEAIPWPDTSSPIPIQVYASSLSLGPPVFSPDGSRLFFEAHQEGLREAARYQRETQRFVPAFPGVPATYVHYSPDGEWITYVTPPESILWRSRFDGSERLQLTRPPVTAFTPAFSPDGGRIAFDFGNSAQQDRIFVLDRDGGVPRPVVKGSASHPCWFPDGKSLLFARRTEDKTNTDGHTMQLFRIDLETGEVTPIPDSIGLENPSLSPDGRYVAATSPDEHQLIVLDLDTRRRRVVARGAALKRPRWSRDSRSLYFQDYMGGKEQPIYEFRLANGSTRKIAGLLDFPTADVPIVYTLAGLDPKDAPVASLVRTKADVHTLQVEWEKR